MIPDIAIKNTDIALARRLKDDLGVVGKLLLNYTPSDFSSRKLKKLRIRIFKFPKNEDCNEFFFTYGKKKYVCVNACLLSRRYYTAFQHVLHGMAHSFCHLKDSIGEEVFAEYVSYSAILEHLENRGKKFVRRIIKSIMKASTKEYNIFFRIARRLEKKERGYLLKLNSKAKNRKISKKKQTLMFSRYTKSRNLNNESDSTIYELEKGFRKI